jgi:hypothetical protein
MRVCLFTIRSVQACHYGLFGYRETLERMGHEVLNCSLPGNAVANVEYVRLHMPSIEGLNKCDCILVTYAEYATPWLAAIYGWEAWSKIKVPIIARFDESMDRVDLGLPTRMPELLKWAHHYSFPAAQDAKKYGGQWLPFGADTTIFKPHIQTQKLWELGFIGTMYGDRKKYLDRLIQHMPPNLAFRYGPVIVQDLSGIRERDSTELLAENYRSLKCFFLLPPLSRLLVEKCWDVMGCGTFLMAPRLFGDAAENLSIFEDRKHLVYYDIGYFADNAKQIVHYLQNDDEREKIAKAGCELVHKKYTLEGMLDQMLAMVSKASAALIQ